MHVPGYLKGTSDDSILSQWQTMGAIGARTVPPLTLLASGANFLASYLSPAQSQRYRFIAAGLLSLSILPYTFVALASTNAELGTREGEKENTLDAGLRSLEIRELIQRWSDRSAVRGFLLVASTIVGYDAILQLTF